MAGASSGAEREEETLVIKVPKWLSDVWKGAAQDSVVADLDLEAGRLRIVGCATDGRPESFEVIRRKSPELFAFTKGGSDTRVEGTIREALQVRADLRDGAYQNLLKRRVEEADIRTGTRSVYLPGCRHPAERPETAGNNLKPLEVAEAAFGEQPRAAEVAVAIERCLKRQGSEGISCEELLANLPHGSSLISIRDALVAMAECRNVGRSRRYVFTTTPAWGSTVNTAAAGAGPTGAGAVAGDPAVGSRLKRPRR